MFNKVKESESKCCNWFSSIFASQGWRPTMLLCIRTLYTLHAEESSGWSERFRLEWPIHSLPSAHTFMYERETNDNSARKIVTYPDWYTFPENNYLTIHSNHQDFSLASYDFNVCKFQMHAFSFQHGSIITHSERKFTCYIRLITTNYCGLA
jgi:hypothetical protein